MALAYDQDERGKFSGNLAIIALLAPVSDCDAVGVHLAPATGARDGSVREVGEAIEREGLQRTCVTVRGCWLL